MIGHQPSGDIPPVAVLPNYLLGFQSGADVVQISFTLGAYINRSGPFIPLLGREAGSSCALQKREHGLQTKAHQN
jgi:hypothetical protein